MEQFKFLLIFFLVFQVSCKKETAPEPEPMELDDCRYQFGPNLVNIIGAWEPKQVINLIDGDTTNFEKGEGAFGFILYDHYADSFEFRPDSLLGLYYVESERFCASRVDGNWYVNNDTIFISRYISDLKKLPIISLSSTELVLLDTINFKFSKATYRKNNE